jgi:hypothetical protein
MSSVWLSLVLTCVICEVSDVTSFAPQIRMRPRAFDWQDASQVYRQSTKHSLSLVPPAIEDTQLLLQHIQEVPSILSSSLTSAADAAAAVADQYDGGMTFDMLMDSDGVVNPWDQIKVEDIPRSTVIEWGQFTQEVNQLSSLNDLLFKAPFAAVLLGLCDFAYNKIAVNDVDEEIRQDDMIGDYEQEDAFFFSGLKIRLAALLVVSISTFLLSKLTFHGPFPQI